MSKNKYFKQQVTAAVEAIKDTVDSNQVHGDTTIAMAVHFGVSRNILQAAFKKQYGICIREYKLLQRMELSRLLLNQGKDIKSVSIEVHYTTQSAFTSAFKRFYGITPSELINGNAHIYLYKKVQSQQ